MSAPDGTPVAVLGLGAMGSALAAALIDAGSPTTVWNRTPGREADLVARGATVEPSARATVRTSQLVITCLFDHASVHETLDPVVDELSGRTLVNVTTTTPNEARELAAWAAEHGVAYLDGAILAVPEMIGASEAAILYSGSAEVFEAQRDLLDLWGNSTYYGTDAGMASLYDLAILSGMYVMFAGFVHGAAMVGSVGVPATEFAAKSMPFLAAIVPHLKGLADVIDGGDYGVPGQQSLEFSELSKFIRACEEQGVSAEPIAMVQTLIRRQREAGHGADGFARIYESLRTSTAETPKGTNTP